MTSITTDVLSWDIDPSHESIDFAQDPLIRDVTRDKYLQKGETFEDMCSRVSTAIMGSGYAEGNAYIAMKKGLLMPAGRILSGAGTSKAVTLMNCYVNHKLQDSMVSIMESVSKVALTLQQGGGIGTDFSPLRPKHAVLRRTGAGSKASGPLPFMHMWDATSQTVRSAGDRRGAMMGTLSDTHPDLPAFVIAKQIKGALEQFNVSILVSDAFMDCVAMDEDWMLYFHVPPVFDRPTELSALDFDDDDGTKQYVYSIWKARDLWEMITKNTYEYSEPGIIYIDRVNELNNLYYCEEIRCTNPCGEQPLPPDGACDLLAINLLRAVHNPFMRNSEIDFDLIQRTAKLGINFLDNVIDVTQYPFEAQQREMYNKRRVGLGISGLADMLAQIGVKYGSARSATITENVMQKIAIAAYEESALLAQEKGVFPLFNKDKILEADFIKKLPKQTRDMIGDLGLRNGVLLTIAPTGTTSVAFGNGSSGLEPNFAWKYNRKVHQEDGSWKTYENVKPYLIKLYEQEYGEVRAKVELPEYFVTAQDLQIIDHLRIQAACQKWIDASVSKTINVPRETTYEEFADVYTLAYQMGCKGCTTYRPSDVRGSILSTDSGSSGSGSPAIDKAVEMLRPRSEALQGSTYKIKWPSWSAAIYITINHDEDGQPFEVFIQSKDARHQEWIMAVTLLISAIFRKGGDVSFVAEELKQIYSTHDTAWSNQKHYPSLVARIAEVIEGHLNKLSNGVSSSTSPGFPAVKERFIAAEVPAGETCTVCLAPGSLIRSEGCKKCTNCGYSSCG